MKHLPPLRLDLACPPGYPATDRPRAALAAPWLGAAQAAELEAALAELWEQQGPGNPVGFTWASWLAAEALDCIGASDVLVLPAPGISPGLDPSPAGSAEDMGATSPARPAANDSSRSSTINIPDSVTDGAGGVGSGSDSGCTAGFSGVGRGIASSAPLRELQPAGDDGSSGAVSTAGDGGGPASREEPAVQVPAARGAEPACASHQHAEAGECREGTARGSVATRQLPEVPGTSLRQAYSGAGAQQWHRRKGGARACEAASRVSEVRAGPDASAGPRQRSAALQPGRRPGAGTSPALGADTSVRPPQPGGLRIEAPAFSPRVNLNPGLESPAQPAPRYNSGSRAARCADGAAGPPRTERALGGAAAAAAQGHAAGDPRPGAAQACGAAAVTQALYPGDSHQAARKPCGGGAAGAAGGAVSPGDAGNPDSAPAGSHVRGQASSEIGVGEAGEADSTEDVLLTLLRYSAAREYQLWQEVRALILGLGSGYLADAAEVQRHALGPALAGGALSMTQCSCMAPYTCSLQ